MNRICFIGLGSNACTPDVLTAAQADLRAAFPDMMFSSLLHTPAVGMDSPRPFFNRTAVCTTSLSPDELRRKLKAIERAHGRRPEDKERGIVNVDLDLLYYDGTVLKPEDWTRDYVRKGVEKLKSSPTKS
ncbi:MAG: 2-amino-4-hydroxy-6-hydroxymethyldihydropteridine diphosphokinase [Paraprevotella sp.]|nr:2-amino-4-hydroxy-6-hydroxymethyldihydropteridine diphosphokinase [Paraprevotella sp.]